MLRSSILLAAAAAAFAGTSAAQTQLNEFRHWPDTVSGASRVGVATTSSGDVTNLIPAAAARGVGTFAAGTPGRLNGWRGTIQDTNRSTAEVYTCAVLGDDAAAPGQPDPANDIIRVGPFNTPTNPDSAGVAWLVTITLNTPADVLPADANYHAAFGLEPSTESSCWIATFSGAGNGDNPRAGAAPNLAHGIDRTALTRSTAPWTARIYLLTESPTLLGGADIDPNAQRGPNPNFGVGGVFLDRARMDGIALRVRDGNAPNGSVATFIGFSGFATQPVALGGIGGEIHLVAPLAPVTIPGVLDANGELDQSVVTFPSSVPALGSIQLQSVVSDAGMTTAKLTNAVEMNDA